MPNDNLTIKHPKRRDQVPQTFVAAGTYTGKRPTITATATRIADGVVTNGTVVSVRKTPGGCNYRWLILFQVAQSGPYLLQVTAIEGATVATERVRFRVDGALLRAEGEERPEVRILAAPIISYPLSNQNIIDERDYFVVYGTRNNATGNTVVGGTVRYGGIVYEHGDVYDNGTNFWTLIFDLSELEPDKTGLLVNSINNSNQSSADRSVDILS